MKRFLPGFGLCIALCAWAVPSLPAPASAYPYYGQEGPQDRGPRLSLRVRRWQTAASAQVRSWMYTPSSWWTPPADKISIGTTGDFKVMDAPLYLFCAEVRPLGGLSFSFETGDNGFSGGKYFEHDWLHAPNHTVYLFDGVTWDRPSHRDFAKKRMRTEGSARQYSAAAYLTVYRHRGGVRNGVREMAHTLEVFVGYSYYETKVRLFDGYKIMSTDFFLPTPPAGPMYGLDSRYRMAWYGWTGGFRERVEFGKNLSAEARFAFGPTMKYRGEAVWNLDPYLAKPGVRNGATGHLVEFELSAAYKFWKNFEAAGGWMAAAYGVGSGREVLRYADGTTLEGDLDKIKATRKGLFFSLGWKF